MTLEQAALWGQLISTVAVLASLVFVGLQIRQNTRSQKVVAVDSLAAAIAAINVPGIASPDLGNALAIAMQDWGAATRDQRIIAHYFLFSYFKLGENGWYQQRNGVLDRDQWLGWESMLRVFFHSPGVQAAWWPRRRYAFSPAFQTFLAGTVPPRLSGGGLNDLFDNAPLPAPGTRP